jgi:hypothetical protein
VRCLRRRPTNGARWLNSQASSPSDPGPIFYNVPLGEIAGARADEMIQWAVVFAEDGCYRSSSGPIMLGMSSSGFETDLSLDRLLRGATINYCGRMVRRFKIVNDKMQRGYRYAPLHQEAGGVWGGLRLMDAFSGSCGPLQHTVHIPKASQ